jgi:hypothetical protein
MIEVRRASLKVKLSFCALQPGALKLPVQMTPASRQSSPPVSPPFVTDFEGFFFFFFELVSEGDVLHFCGLLLAEWNFYFQIVKRF